MASCALGPVSRQITDSQEKINTNTACVVSLLLRVFHNVQPLARIASKVPEVGVQSLLIVAQLPPHPETEADSSCSDSFLSRGRMQIFLKHHILLVSLFIINP